MDDDEDEGGLHINGCPCCIVRFLPMHRVCKDPHTRSGSNAQRWGGKVFGQVSNHSQHLRARIAR